MKVAIFLAIVLVGLVAVTLADDHSVPNTRDVQTPAEDRKLLLLGKKLLKMMKKRPRPVYQPAPYAPPPSYGAPPSYGPPPPPYRR